MKRTVTALLVMALAFALTYASAQAQMGSGGMMAEQGQTSQQQYRGTPGYGRGYGGYGMMGPGMMGGYGRGYGGYGRGYGMMGGPGMMGGCGMGQGMMGGPGMMGGYGMMGGQGMMGGYGMGPGMMGGYGMMGGPGMMYQPGMQKLLEQTRDLRKDIQTKQFEFFEAQRDPKTTRETLVSLQKELNDLMLKLQKKMPTGSYGGY